MRLRKDRCQFAEREADAGGNRKPRQRRQGSIEITAAIPKPVVGAIEADQWREHQVRDNHIAGRRDWNVPEATLQWLARPPAPILQWFTALHDNRQAQNDFP